MKHTEYLKQWFDLIADATDLELEQLVKKALNRKFDPFEFLIGQGYMQDYRTYQLAIDSFDAGLVNRLDIKRWAETKLEGYW